MRPTDPTPHTDSPEPEITHHGAALRAKALYFVTAEDVTRAGDFSRPVCLDNYPGMWWLLERPMLDMNGRPYPVRALFHCTMR